MVKVNRFYSDLLRVFSVTFIIFNHVSWPYYSSISHDRTSLFYQSMVFLQLLGKPSTLLFLFLSGVAFSSVAVKKEFFAGDFYTSRFFRIVPAYVLVSFLYLAGTDVSLQQFAVYLLSGRAKYHLYFVVVIIIMYVLFPLLRKLLFSVKNAVILWSFTLALMAIVSWLNPAQSPYYFTTAPIPLGSEALVWMDYLLFGFSLFLSGLWAGNIGHRQGMEQKKKYFILLAIVFFMLQYLDFYFRLEQGLSADDAGRTWRLSTLLYGAAMVFLLASLKVRQKSELVGKLARSGFLVYLFHPFVIDYFKPALLNYPLQYIVVSIILSWLTGYALYEISRRFLPVGLLLGEGDRIVKEWKNKSVRLFVPENLS